MSVDKPLAKLLLPLALIAGITNVGCPPPPENPLFSFVVIADPHVPGNPESENALRLADCVEWINANKDENLIELAFVVGDIGHSSGLALAKDMLDGLTVPYLPLIGDNIIQSGYETTFGVTYESQYDDLAIVLENWQKAPTPVWNPEIEEDSYFQNYSFDYRGIHFACLDWATRVIDPAGEDLADLHDFTGGTWPWFTNDIQNCDKSLKENILMLSHHPMHVNPIIPGVEYASFSVEEATIIETFTGGFGEYVSANLAGHYHYQWVQWRELGQYGLYVTEATFIYQNSLKLVRVYSDGETFTYHLDRVVVP